MPDKVPEDRVLLPFSAQGKAPTALKKRSAAARSWLLEVSESDIRNYIGLVPPKQLEEILACVEKRKEANDHENRE